MKPEPGALSGGMPIGHVLDRTDEPESGGLADCAATEKAKKQRQKHRPEDRGHTQHSCRQQEQKRLSENRLLLSPLAPLPSPLAPAELRLTLDGSAI